MQARAHRYLASAYTYLDDLTEAETHLQHALDLSESVSDRTGQAHAHLDLSWVWDRRAGYRQAHDHAQQALSLYTADGDQRGHATALNAVGCSLLT